jgi:hypothetical protein
MDIPYRPSEKKRKKARRHEYYIHRYYYYYTAVVFLKIHNVEYLNVRHTPLL